MLDCVGLIGPNRSLWLYCLAEASETYSYSDFLVGTYHWSDEGELGEVLYIQQPGQALISKGLRRLSYDEAPLLYALARLVEFGLC
jgi:hypothetical protein